MGTAVYRDLYGIVQFTLCHDCASKIYYDLHDSVIIDLNVGDCWPINCIHRNNHQFPKCSVKARPLECTKDSDLWKLTNDSRRHLRSHIMKYFNS